MTADSSAAATAASFQYGMLMEFDESAEPWASYIERVELYFAANNVPADKHLPILLCSVGKKHYGLLRDLVAPAPVTSKSYAETVALLQDFFSPKPLVIAERFRFYNRGQGASETITEYVAALRRHSEHCAFGTFLNEALRDRFVCGLRSLNLQKRLLSESDLTFSKATEIALALETATKDAGELQGKAPTPESLHHIARKIKAKNVPSPTQASPKIQSTGILCYRCGDPTHKANACKYANVICRGCQKKGHLQKVCRSSTRPLTGKGGAKPKGNAVRLVSTDVTDSTSTSSVPDVGDVSTNTVSQLHLHHVARDAKAFWITPTVQGIPLKMELDTGSAVSIISESIYLKHYSEISLSPDSTIFKTYSGEQLRPLGKLQVQVEYNGQSELLDLYVIKEGVPLFGRDWLYKIKLDWATVGLVHAKQESPDTKRKLSAILSEHEELFTDELGVLKGTKAKICVPSTAKAVFCKARPVPFSLRPQVDTELERLENEGIISRVNFSDWATPIVPVPKPDGSVRLCGDYKVTVNPVLQIDQYPLPKVEDMFANLAGGQKFSKIDLKHAYLQMELEEDSKRFLTINTHRGLFQYNRLPFGIASAPAIWQRTIDQIVQDCPRTQGRLDDILVTGKDDIEHLQNVRLVLARLQQFGLKVNKAKCEFLKDELTFCGHRIDKHGLHKTDDKIQAVVQAPRPTSVTEVRSFLGLVNYYAKFIPHCSIVLSPLFQLLKKGHKFEWSSECEKAFHEAKSLITSDHVLVHYDPQLPIHVACDAAPNGIGCVLSHVTPEGADRPIAYASRSLTETESKYSQIDREGLAIVWGVKHFYNYLYGRHFTLVTDNKPLMHIFGPHKGVPVVTAARLQRFAIFLSGLDYSIIHRPTDKHGNADGLSRLPVSGPTMQSEDPVEVFYTTQMEKLPITASHIRQATARDPVLSVVFQYTHSGWPESAELGATLQPYCDRRTEISISHGVLLWGYRVIIPDTLRSELIQELHQGHVGIVKMKGLARSYCWWPSIDKDLETVAKTCSACTAFQNAPTKSILHPWEWPTSPWRRVHMDFAGPFLGKHFLLLVDAHSKWPEVVPMPSTTSTATIEVLRNIFARNGIPEHIVTDNGPQFTSVEFQSFTAMNGILHSKTAPYHPATNGLAERFVQTFKQGMRAGIAADPHSFNRTLSNFLLSYRNSPHSTTKVSPAELFLGRRLNTRLDLIRPDPRRQVDRQNCKSMFQSGASREFSTNQPVSVRNYSGSPKWLPGTVQKQVGPLSYQVLTGDRTVRRHADQISDLVPPSPSFPPPAPPVVPTPDSSPVTTEGSPGTSPGPSPSHRYPTRVRKPPARFGFS